MMLQGLVADEERRRKADEELRHALLRVSGDLILEILKEPSSFLTGVVVENPIPKDAWVVRMYSDDWHATLILCSETFDPVVGDDLPPELNPVYRKSE
jgi:hypothetical protein